MGSYEFNYEKENRIRSLPSRKALADFISSNRRSMTRYQWLLIAKNKHFDLAMLSGDDLDSIDWEYICMSRQLSIHELERYESYLNWYCVSAFQKLTIDFIKRHKDDLSLNAVLRNESISQEYMKAKKIYDANNDERHWMIWRDNLKMAESFCPSRKAMLSKESKKAPEIPAADDILKMDKAMLRKCLDDRGISYLQRATNDELRAMLRKAMAKEARKMRKEAMDEDARFDALLLDRIREENDPAGFEGREAGKHDHMPKRSMKENDAGNKSLKGGKHGKSAKRI